MRNRALYKNRKPLKIGEILKEVIGNLEASKKTDAKSIDVLLKKAVPKKLITHIRAQKKSKRRLIIHVDSPTWLYEANKYKEKILKTVQQGQASSEIKEICFRVGKIR